MINLLDLTYPELEALMLDLGEKKFRARQIYQWLWEKDAATLDEMTNLSKALRAGLAEKADIRRPAVDRVAESSDGTIKLLLRLVDGEQVETVIIPEKTHYTQCISSQVGCPMACEFCSTGRMGLTRNMSAGEIAGQVLVARRFMREREAALPEEKHRNLRNIVVMGMGEPLLNTGNLLRALTLMTDADGMNFSTRRITVSTCGIPKGIREFGEHGLGTLAVSLHAATQELRSQLMPKAAGVTLDELMATLDSYPLKPRDRITYEYILLRGVNDTITHAKQLVRLLGQRKAKVNLIAYNPPREGVVDGIDFEAPDPDQVLAFESYLRDHGITTTLRKSKGQDIGAACGQLKAEAEAEQRKTEEG